MQAIALDFFSVQQQLLAMSLGRENINVISAGVIIVKLTILKLAMKMKIKSALSSIGQST